MTRLTEEQLNKIKMIGVDKLKEMHIARFGRCLDVIDNCNRRVQEGD